MNNKPDEYRIVEVVPHDPEWKKLFQTEAVLLKSIFRDEAVEMLKLSILVLQRFQIFTPNLLLIF